MTRVLFPSPVPSHDAFASSSKSSITTSVVALTPSTDDASVVTPSDSDTDVPVHSVEYTPESQWLASVNSAPRAFTFRSPSPIRFTPSTDSASVMGDIEGDPDVRVSSVEPLPEPGPTTFPASFQGYFTGRPSHIVNPSISLSPPAPSNDSNSTVSSKTILTPDSHSSVTSVRAAAIDAAGRSITDSALDSTTPAAPMPISTEDGTSKAGQLAFTSPDTPETPLVSESITVSSDLSSSVTPTRTTTSVDGGAIIYSHPSSPAPVTPRNGTTGIPPTMSSELSTPGLATPLTTATPSTVAHNEYRDSTPEVFNLLSVQAAISQPAQPPGSVAAQPTTPRHHHRSSTPVLTPPSTTQRRRRSSSAVPQPRHEVSSETPPTSRFHEPGFQSALRSAKQLMSDLSSVLCSSSSLQQHDPDSTVRRLQSEAARLAAFSPPATRTVGFVGDSGVGKSSLINSLLDVRGLARTSASGAACTCVVTEYAYRGNGGGDGFEIAVQWLGREEVERQIEEMVEGYRHFCLSEGLDEDEVREYGEKAQVAEDMFRAMFRGRLGERDISAVLLEGGNAGDEDEEALVVQQLMDWLDDMPRSTPARERFEDAESCSRRLMELTSDLGSGEEAALWPLIRKIRVSCNAHILSKGLILVDLPGLRDVNSARRNIAERYILNCDEIFAVCNIIRAITDEGVMAVIDLAKKASLSNVGIICTRSDDIQADEATKDWKGELAGKVTAIQKDAVTVAEQNLRALEEEVRGYEEIDVDDWFEEERIAYTRLCRRVSEAKKLVAQREFELKRYLILTRNHIVREQLREAYVELIPADDLPVFCVSNTDYWSHRDQPGDVSKDFLELSGMIEVRKHCISIVAESQLRSATLFMRKEIPALLESLQLWVQSGSGSSSAEKKRAIRDSLDKVEETLRKGLTRQSSELNRLAIKDRFREFLAHYQSKDIWVQGASNAADEWSTWAWNTYEAFCRRYGCYTTRAVGSHDWNEEAMESMVFTLSPRWSELCMSIERCSRNASSILKSLCEEAVGILVSEEQLDDDQIELLTSSIRTHHDLLEAKLDRAYSEVKRDLATLRTDVLTGIRTSFIGEAMESAYGAASRESGGGSDARRKAIIRRRLCSEDIFTEMETRLAARFNDIAAELMAEQSKAANAHFVAIKQNLDMLRDENVILEAERDPDFRKKVDEEVLIVRDRLNELVSGL